MSTTLPSDSATGVFDAADTATQRGGRVGGRWILFLSRRLIRIVASALVVATVSFFVVRLGTSDPIREALGPTAPQAVVDARRAEAGLDLPLWQQYLSYLGGLLRGELGISFLTGQDVSAIVATRLPMSMMLAGIAICVVLIVAIPLGFAVAILTRGGRRPRRLSAFNLLTSAFASVPDYLLAVVLVVVFAIWLRWFPVAGASTPASFVLPVAALSISSIALLSRITRVEAQKTLTADYIVTARSKRIPAHVIYLRHTLPNMLTALLTLTGTIFTTIITAGTLVEQVFNWPGLGYSLIQAVSSRDYSVVAGIALVYALIVLAVTLLIDILLGVLDRRSTILEA